MASSYRSQRRTSHIRDVVNGRLKTQVPLPLLHEWLQSCIDFTGNCEDFVTTCSLQQSHKSYCEIRSDGDLQMSAMISKKRFERQLASSLLSKNRRYHDVFVTKKKLQGGARGYCGIRITRPGRCAHSITKEEMISYLRTSPMDRPLPFRCVRVERDFRSAGMCAIASKTITRGSIVAEYRGERISDSEAQRRLSSIQDGEPAKLLWVYTKSAAPMCVIDGDSSDYNPAALINHSRNNTNLKLTTVTGAEPDPAVLLIAKQDISQGMELLFDYGTRHGADFLRQSQTLQPCPASDNPSPEHIGSCHNSHLNEDSPLSSCSEHTTTSSPSMEGVESPSF
ncbi:uncharacterized protein LOC118408087 isoform X2 [Branchiostoma floridae]|uniref:Uncharacterized protein LOC118408087 isoform X2 n=1 Tax=Branchiostoma floridae TaxID=7739 RepID=A0A9J7KL86_BRAFL|nr:uncharacterized protein LOC118408087 isoform X2 [Branchiostoma floridae]